MLGPLKCLCVSSIKLGCRLILFVRSPRMTVRRLLSRLAGWARQRPFLRSLGQKFYHGAPRMLQVRLRRLIAAPSVEVSTAPQTSYDLSPRALLIYTQLKQNNA